MLWSLTRADLFAPAMAQAGLIPDRVIYVEAGDDKAVLACMEDCNEKLFHRTLRLLSRERIPLLKCF